MQMHESDDVIEFIKKWQSTLQEAVTSRCSFTNSQQVNLLFAALLDSWSAFITTQGGIPNLEFTTLISNILQQNAINLSKSSKTQSNAFYIKGKFVKPSPSKPGHFKKSS